MNREDTDSIPWGVERLVRACLEKEPSHRPKSADELIAIYKEGLFDKSPSPPVQTEQAREAFPESAPQDVEQIKIDPNAVVYHMEASLTRSVAEHKLLGFVRDAGGAVVESVPGLIRVRLGQPGSLYELTSGSLSWLGFGCDAGLVEVYLYLRDKDPKQPDLQTVTVLMLSLKGFTAEDASWSAHCSRIYKDLRGYLMGQDVSLPV